MVKMTMAAARVNANLTQEQLAEMMGVSRVTINKWETGKVRMKTPYVYLFCDIAGISLDDFLLPWKSTKSKPKKGKNGRKNTKSNS